MYVRLIEGNQIEYCPIEIIEKGQRIIGFTDEFLKEQGYKQLVLEPRDMQNENLKLTYEELEDCIVQRWSETI